MKNLIIAKRYAKALFNIGLEDGLVEQYGQELEGFVTLLKETPALEDAITNPLYPEDARRQVLNAVADKAGLSQTVKSFLGLMVEKNRAAYMGEVLEYFRKLVDAHNNVARAKVAAAAKLDDETLKSIADTLAKITGKTVVVEFSRDPVLIGGVVARIGDLVIDGSVRTQLQSIKESLKRGELS